VESCTYELRFSAVHFINILFQRNAPYMERSGFRVEGTTNKIQLCSENDRLYAVVAVNKPKVGSV